MFAVQRPIIMCYRIAGIFRGYKCSRIEPVPRKFMNSRRVQYYGFEANGVEVQLHVDVRMHQKAGTQTTKIKSAKIYTLEIYPLYGIIVAYTFNAAPLLVSIYLYRITRMFCDHQTFAKFARFDQFATIKSAKPKLSLVNTHDPFQLERKGSTFLLIWLIRKGFHSQNILVIRYVYSGLTAFLLSSSGPHQQALIYGLTAYQPVASSLALANTRYTSPGPLPLTPNGPGGSTVFNFSPAKPMRSVLQGNKGGKTSDGLLHPAAGGGATIHYQQTMLAGTVNSSYNNYRLIIYNYCTHYTACF